MRPICCLAALLALAGAPALACSEHSEEATAGLCGSARIAPARTEPFADCGPGRELACATSLQRARDAAVLVVRYRAINRANLDGCAFAR